MSAEVKRQDLPVANESAYQYLQGWESTIGSSQYNPLPSISPLRSLVFRLSYLQIVALDASKSCHAHAR